MSACTSGGQTLRTSVLDSSACRSPCSAAYTLVGVMPADFVPSLPCLQAVRVLEAYASAHLRVGFE